MRFSRQPWRLGLVQRPKGHFVSATVFSAACRAPGVPRKTFIFRNPQSIPTVAAWIEFGPGMTMIVVRSLLP